MRLLFYCKILLLIPLTGMGQEYKYKHYDSRDGLAGSSVMRMLQDKNGFIWFATQKGVSRFDGTHFKNYSASDGLTGNMILRMFEDSRGRIWLIPFTNAICYYYKGKIHNQQNDSLLRKINLGDHVRDIVENKDRELLLTDAKYIYHIDASDNLRRIGEEMTAKGWSAALAVGESGNFIVRFGNQLFVTSANKLSHLRNISHPTATMEHFIMRGRIACWMDMNTLCVELSGERKSFCRKQVGPVNTMYFLSDSMLCLNTPQGTCFYNLLQQKIEKHFLPDGDVSDFLVDKEGGYWFSTQNDGVFRLSSPAFKTIAGRTKAGQKLGVYSLEKAKDVIWAGCDMAHVMKISNKQAHAVALTVDGEVLGRHLVYGLAAKYNRLVAACGDYIFVKDRDGPFIDWIGSGSSKGIAWKASNELLVTSSAGLFQMNADGTNQKIMYQGRTSCVYVRNDSAWFGTRNGLYLMTPDDSISNLGTVIPLLRVPTFAIYPGLDGTIWVATSGSGLVGLQNNTVKWHFSTHNGFNSDKVRSVYVDSGVVWAATENELNKILLQPHPEITRYSYSEELSCHVVNTLLVDGNTVYAGTNDGITFFDKRESPGSSICDLKLLGVRVSDEDRELQSSYVLPYQNNSIRFEYVAISMKSAGNVMYHYRLNGLDTTWKSTAQTSLELLSLPPGEYDLELFAINKFDVKSSPYSVHIIVENPFWKSVWFMAAAIVLTSLIAWFLGTRRNLAALRREKVRKLAEQQLADLEQKALRAQMNPHFIFNSLQSIQSFILDKDPENANKYLSQFASLIRQTLENSLQSSILLADEIKYLNTYLRLEQMRSESKFQYHITTEERLSTRTVSIPVMILQPFVENAVRHGVQPDNSKPGLINIHFSSDHEGLVCRVEDNGIGRQLAQLRKSTAPVAYRSRGMQLTYERIQLMNINSVKKITVEIVDKFNERSEPDGTLVIIKFPIFNN